MPPSPILTRTGIPAVEPYSQRAMTAARKRITSSQGALAAFVFVVLAHWMEHLAQIVQVYALNLPRSRSHGLLGWLWPSLASSELLHYFYALGMLIGLVMFLPRFHGWSRAWWMAALGAQAWHHFEHLLLVVQVQTGHNLFGQPRRTSIVEMLGVQRIELHFFYNGLATLLMLVGLAIFARPNRRLTKRHGRSAG